MSHIYVPHAPCPIGLPSFFSSFLFLIFGKYVLILNSVALNKVRRRFSSLQRKEPVSFIYIFISRCFALVLTHLSASPLRPPAPLCLQLSLSTSGLHSRLMSPLSCLNPAAAEVCVTHCTWPPSRVVSACRL